MAAEIVKAQINAGRRRELYYFRDEQGLEVDFVVPGKTGSVTLVECKTSRTPTPAMAAPMQRLAKAMKKKRRAGTTVEMYLVHRQPKSKGLTQAVAPGVRVSRGRTSLTRFRRLNVGRTAESLSTEPSVPLIMDIGSATDDIQSS